MRVFLFLLLLFLIHCDDHEKGQQTKRSETGTAKLTYWCAANPREIKLAETLVQRWNAGNRDIQVHLQPLPSSQSSEEVLLAAIAGGTTPDVCSNMWPGAMDDFVQAGGLVRLDAFPDYFEYLRNRVPDDLLHSFRAADSHYYQIPWKTNPIMMVYNKRIFREAGVEAPLETYSDFMRAAKKIVVDANADGLTDQWMLYRDIKPLWWQRLFDYYTLYIGASGGKTLFNGTRLVFDNPASVEVFRFLREMYAKGYLPVTQFQGDQFLGERLATQITGPWMISYIETFRKQNFEYGVMSLPRPDSLKGPLYTYGDHKNISIFNTTKYPRQAWEFAKFLVSEDADLGLLEICSQIPIRKNLTALEHFKPYFASHPRLVPFAEQAPLTRGVDGVSVLKEIFDAISQEYESCVLYQEKSPENAIADAADRARVILEWSYGE